MAAAFDVSFESAIRLASPLLVAILSGWAKKFFEARPRLVTFLVHSVAHPLPVDPNTGKSGGDVHTHSIVVKNTGKKTAHNVRIDHAVFPPSYVLTPPISHVVSRGQGESAEICIPVLVPGEQVTISYLYAPPLTWNVINGWVKSDEGMARSISVIPSSPPPKPVIFILWALTFLGASTLVYWVLRSLPHLLS